MAVSDSQGNNFVFSGSTYTVTSVTVTPGGDLIDITHLGIASNQNRVYQVPALRDDEINCEAYGNTVLTIGANGPLSFANTVYTATVASCSVSYSVGELVKISATFKVKSS
jgi:hypothetical protein